MDFKYIISDINHTESKQKIDHTIGKENDLNINHTKPKKEIDHTINKENNNKEFYKKNYNMFFL